MNIKPETLKQDLLSSLLETRASILDAASHFSAEAQNTIFLGTWSFKDLLAHLAGWDFTNLSAVEDIQAGKLPEFYARYDKDWKTYNAELVAKYKRDDFEELLALVRDSHRQLIEYLEILPADAFETDFGVRSGRGTRVTIARLLQAEWKDEQEHLKQIQEFVGKVQKIKNSFLKGETMGTRQRVIHIGILLLAFEKTVQHLLTALFFAVDLPGIGRPDIGPTFQLSDTMMVILNLIVGVLFSLGFWGRLAGQQWHRPLLIGLSLFDILAEFVFHGFFFITWSVIAAAALLVLFYLDKDNSRKKSSLSASQR